MGNEGRLAVHADAVHDRRIAALHERVGNFPGPLRHFPVGETRLDDVDVVLNLFVRELVISALALDYAPSVALHWGATGNNKVSGNNLVDYRYDFLPGFENMGAGEHGLAHPANNGGFGGTTHVITTASSARDRVRVRRWFFNQMKLVMDRLSSTADGDGSLMDNTTILFASEFGGPTANGGAQHSNRDLPYMILGGKNSPFRLGQAMTVSNRKHGDFLLTLAKGMGSTVSAVGKGTATIDGILK